MNEHKIKKTIYIVGTNGLGVNYGGWDKLVSKIIEKSSKKYNIYVYTSSFEDLTHTHKIVGAKPIIIPLKANGYQSILYDFFSMLHAVFNKADVILVLGLSGGIFFPIFKLFKSKVVLNPDGAEWKRTKWSFLIKQYLKLSEAVGVIFSDLVISDNNVIKNDIKKSYSVSSVVAEYGGDHVKENITIKDETLKKLNLKENRYAFKVCRIVPENNLNIVLDAFLKINKKLVLVGNWNNSIYGINLKKEFSVHKNLILLDPIYDQSTLDELRGNCRLYIHGHSVGGTNPSLVEAMYLSLCCIVFDVNYNRETTNNSAGYFKNKEDLCALVSEIWEDDERISLIRDSMKKIAKDKYSWNRIINIYEKSFDSLT